jgi:hypothetical protein
MGELPTLPNVEDRRGEVPREYVRVMLEVQRVSVAARRRRPVRLLELGVLADRREQPRPPVGVDLALR